MPDLPPPDSHAWQSVVAAIAVLVAAAWWIRHVWHPKIGACGDSNRCQACPSYVNSAGLAARSQTTQGRVSTESQVLVELQVPPDR